MNINKITCVVLSAILLIPLFGCRSQTLMPTEIEVPIHTLGPDILSPCDITQDMLGQDVTVGGAINWVDTTSPDGIFLEIEYDNCRIEAYFEDYSSLNEAQKQVFQEGSLINITGIVRGEDDPPLFIQTLTFSSPDTNETVEEEVIPKWYVMAEIPDDPLSRWQDVVLTFTDTEGNPVEGLEVDYQQLDLDFLFSIEYGGLPYEMFVEEDYAGLFWDLGINNFQLSPYWLWYIFEPQDNDFRWWVEFSPPSFCPEIAVGESDTCEPRQIQDYGIPEDRKPFVKGSAVVGLFLYNFESDCQGLFPEFVNCNDLDGEFKSQYEDFLVHFVKHYMDQIALYRVGLEVNYGDGSGATASKDMEWAAEWITWQCEIIKGIDPEAVISVDLLDWRSNANADQQLRDNNNARLAGGKKSLGMFEDEFIDLLISKGAQFDVIGIELHPGYMITFDGAEAELELLEQYGKPIYVWEDIVPSQNEARAVRSCGSRGTCPDGGFSEEYQAETVIRFFKMLIEEHPLVIGFEYLGFRDNEDLLEPLPSDERDPDVPTTHGWVSEDASPKPVYHAVQEYWHSLFTNGQGITDENGQITFTAIPGWFAIMVDGKNEVLLIAKETNKTTIEISNNK